MMRYALNFNRNRRLSNTAIPLLLLLSLTSVIYGQQRRLQPSDLGRLEELGDRYSTFPVSPDGELLAFVVQRAKTGSKSGVRESALLEERSDVWLTSLTTFKTWNLTDGASSSTGFFMPVWSPDGNYLAMISSGRGSEKVVVWDRREGKIREVLNQAIHYWFTQEPSMVWFANDSFVCSLRPRGRRPVGIENQQLSAEIAIRDWQKYWHGEGPTASVLDSGVEPVLDPKSSGELARVNVLTGKIESLDQGAFRNLQVSPDRKYLAYLKQRQKFRPVGGRPMTSRSPKGYVAFGYQIEVINQSGESQTPKSLPFINADSLTWDHSGRNISIVAEDPGATEGTIGTYVLNVDSKTVRKLFGKTVEGSDSVWLGDDLAVQVNDKTNPRSESRGRNDWWLTRTTKDPNNLTAQLPSSPGRIVGLDSNSAVAISRGELWRLVADGSGPKRINTGLRDMRSIVWPVNLASTKSKLIIETAGPNEVKFYLVDVASGLTEEFPKPEKDATIVGFDQDRTAIMAASTRTGTYVWLAEAGKRTTRLVYETNQFLRDIAEGQQQQIEYKTNDRQTMKAWIVLPPDYEKGKRYPVVTWVYPGLVLGNETPSLTRLNNSHSLNFQLYAARGYVVLFPSIPLSPAGQSTDMYGELANGVFPAIDRLIELGIADPDRIAVAGHSRGGYGTLAIITQTRRFKAAIASAGPSDHLSYFAQFSLAKRYLAEPLEGAMNMHLLEGLTAMGFRLGNPPWKDFGLYIRNSPMFFVERVETPLLLIHGDLDGVPIEQAEQFFSALYRQGKRARFVRYWGEDHVIESPQNIVDMWEKIYEWLDEFVIPSPQ